MQQGMEGVPNWDHLERKKIVIKKTTKNHRVKMQVGWMYRIQKVEGWWRQAGKQVCVIVSITQNCQKDILPIIGSWVDGYKDFIIVQVIRRG